MKITDVIIYCDKTLTRLPVTHPNKEVSSKEALERYRKLLQRHHKDKIISINTTENPKGIYSNQEWCNWIDRKNKQVIEQIEELKTKMI